MNLLSKSRAKVSGLVFLSFAVFSIANAQTTTVPGATITMTDATNVIIQTVAQAGWVPFTSNILPLIPLAMPNNEMVFTGFDQSGIPQGDNLVGFASGTVDWTTNSSLNVGASGILSMGYTQGMSIHYTGTTTNAWSAYANTDGRIHLKIEVTAYTNMGTFKGTLDQPTLLPVQVLKPQIIQTGPPPSPAPPAPDAPSGAPAEFTGYSYNDQGEIYFYTTNAWNWSTPPEGTVTIGRPIESEIMDQ